MNASRLSFLLLALGVTAQAAPVTIEKFDVVYELAADGTSSVEYHTVTRINERSAVASSSQRAMAYSPSRQRLEIIEAYTTTKEGMRVDVDPAKILDQQHPASTSAPAHSDFKVRNVIFPQVEVGASITLRYRFDVLKPQLPGVFANGESFNRFTEYGKASVTLRAPANAPMQVYARNVQGGPVEPTRPGTREWRWTHGPSIAETREPGSVDEASISPGVMFSTVADYPALADAYARNAAASVRVTPAVRKLADEITKGVSGKREALAAIHCWVSTEVRSVGIAPALTNWTPRNADEIIADRRGDSKDKATLLAALLAARDIHAVPALINSANRYSWQEIPLLGPFTRVIAYVPEFDLYLETLTLTPFDSLPAQLRGRAVLIAGDARIKSVVRQTPDVDSAKDRTVVRTIARMAGDGAVTGSTSVEAHGAQQSAIRAVMSSIPERDLPQLAKILLATTGQEGESTLKPEDPRDLSKPYAFTITFTTPDRVTLPGPGALDGQIGGYGSEISTAIAGLLQVDRKLDFPCPVGGMEQQLELSLPEGMKISSMPGPADITSAYGSYKSRHEVREGKLLVTRDLQLRRPQTVCTATEYAELRRFATAVDADLRKQILYE